MTTHIPGSDVRCLCHLAAICVDCGVFQWLFSHFRVFPQAPLGKKSEQSLGASAVVLPNQKLVPEPKVSQTNGECSRQGHLSLMAGGTSHSSILPWRIPWTEEPGELQSVELERISHDWAANKYNTALKLPRMKSLHVLLKSVDLQDLGSRYQASCRKAGHGKPVSSKMKETTWLQTNTS